MNRRAFLTSLAAAGPWLRAGRLRGRPPRAVEADVCVYGGTAAGVMAAIQAARMGASVALVAPERHLGGMSVEGLGGSDINNHSGFENDAAVGGLALDFYRRIARHYGRDDFEARRADPAVWRFESSVAEGVIEAMLAEHPVAVFRTHRLAELPGAVRKAEGRVTEIATEPGLRFRAGVFIDATIEGDLLHAAGVTTTIGREANAVYGEATNGIRGTNTYRQFAVRVDPYRVPGDPSSGLIPTVQDEPLGTPGAGDDRIQAYCFRACLTQRPGNRIPFWRPDGYDRGLYEIYLRYLAAGGDLYRPHARLPSGKTDLGAWHDLSHNLYGMNHAYPGGSYATRAQVFQEHLTFTQGLFYFFATDPAVPEAVRRDWSSWGVTRDEFTDHDGWPRQFYVRDGHRLVSDYVITEHHTRKENGTPVPDPVGVAYWPPDVHHVRRIVRDGAAYNEGFVFGGDAWKPFGVSYRALVPRRAEALNLLAPACPSASHIAWGAIRLEWTFMVLGQSAGTAAVLAHRAGVPVQDVPYATLRRRLLRDGHVLELG